MSDWRVEVGASTTRIGVDDYALLAEIGAQSLSDRVLLADPPRPEELTNAIGEMTDHLDDVVRERPDAVGSSFVVLGAAVEAIAAVEIGRTPELPLALSRDAVEDVFRTLATEPVRDRRHNPGLPADLVDTVIAACCIVVAIMRRLQLDEITVAS